MKKTLRLIITKQCNKSCFYCCNEHPDYFTQFDTLELHEIDFAKYKNVCVTGGEPFLHKKILYPILNIIPADMGIYIYTNGLLMTHLDITRLTKLNNLISLNISLHNLQDTGTVLHTLESWGMVNAGIELPPVRFQINRLYEKLFLTQYPVLEHKSIKLWEMDVCSVSHEDWVVLKPSGVA